MLAQGRSASQKQQEKDAIPIWEWIVAGIGLLLVAGVMSFLIYEAFTGNRLPPDVKLSVNSVVQTHNGFLVRITAVNEGGTTAEGVIVEGRDPKQQRAFGAKPDHYGLSAAAL